ncbi:efflux RND transporter periplasmic adaptor subunit [Chryseobacterium turcicum]|uniref:Efflux RND transporter periplasmic adaptor subunit n=1 Tax=Chryseobacterium turcicum TaxID=2898076 RepID=A0A9Q3V117_9FLAO|nr:efflux RND transporter periplasmic adaptor subunit [Chryseobacterium turcicum]MCD1117588.1 efflux RND transporter periplasmic adaptor subunit [Chryseobacterium turcicum]
MYLSLQTFVKEKLVINMRLLKFHPNQQYFVLATMFLFCSCKDKEKPAVIKDVQVNIQRISTNNNIFPTEYIGTVVSENAVDISFLASGNIEQLYANEGQKVTKGQLLGRLNTTSLKYAHDLSVSSLHQAQDAYKRLSAMYKNKSLPEIQFIDVRTKLEQALASEAIAKKSLQDCNLYAPQSGVVGNRFLEPGANVMPGTPVYKILDVSNVKIKTAIPENEISGINTGMLSTVKISALNNEAFNGKIIEKGVSADAISHTYDVMVRISNPESRIMPGMVCKVYPDVTAENSAGGSIVVPIKAVQIDFSGKRFVWIVDDKGKAAYREVKLGQLSGDGVSITSGLKEGEQLITAGYQNISVGTKVSVIK